MSVYQIARFVPIAGIVLLLQGCSSLSSLSKSDEIAVDSEPSGASVYVMGKALGQTPMVLRYQDVFPVTYEPDQQDLYGIVILKSDGCQEYLQRVDNKVLKKGVKATLDCREFAAKPAPTQIPKARHPDIPVPAAPVPLAAQATPAAQTTPAAQATPGAQASASIKQRLIRLEKLHQEGLITDEEYGAARRRILDEL